MADIKELRKHLEKRREALRLDEQKIEPHWRELRDFVQPFRGRFSGEKPGQTTPSMKRILDGSTLRARRILSAGMQSGLTSPSRQWFKLSVHDPELAQDYAVKEWCDEVHRRMMIIMSGSSFYHALHAVYDEIATFGTACMLIFPDFNSVISCRTLTCGTYYLGKAESDRVDSLYRDMYMTAGAIVAEFGKANCSNAVLKAAQEQPDTTFEIRHAIEPSMGRHQSPFISVYWEPASLSDKVLRIGGYRDFPSMTPRWHVVDSDIYGYGPGSEVLPDAKTLQVMARDRAEGIKKQVAPPLVASDALRGSAVRSNPNGITYAPGGAGPMITPLYNVPLNLGDLQTAMAEVKQAIDSAMYVDLFLMLQSSDNPQMTAREIIERHDEKMLVLGPVLERLELELLTPAIDRVYNIMVDAELIPEPPEPLAGQEIKIEFVSILAQAQQMMGLKAVEQTLSFAGGLAAINPEVVDILDLDASVREYAAMIGAPTRILKRVEDVEAIRAQRAQAQAQQTQADQELQAANTANVGAQAAQVMASIDEGTNGALDALMGFETSNVNLRH